MKGKRISADLNWGDAAYAEKGGKIYVSCMAAQWVERPFPEVIDFVDDMYETDDSFFPGQFSSEPINTWGRIEDSGMRKWLKVVAPDVDLDLFPLRGMYVAIDSLSYDSNDGFGMLEDGTVGGPILPRVWATDLQQYPGKPMTITFNYKCGKVFYSTYHVVEEESADEIRPQEWVLIYLFYEVIVCDGEIGSVV
ncbi:MAG: hypothetical protein GY847_06145 [Proteobacteria bacterium]|nr:hypothetical protein [Pseudomonadota bacterium]